MAAVHPLGCACTVDILNATPEPVRRKIKVKRASIQPAVVLTHVGSEKCSRNINLAVKVYDLWFQ
jgi:hypothetical protein